MIAPKTWAYGVTTVPARKVHYLPRTLESLKTAGFECPRLFIDGCHDPKEYDRFGLEVTVRYPTIRPYGNWVLALAELYLRSPAADRFAIFQDDFVTYRNLRTYLDEREYPGERDTRPKGYYNLYTFPHNQTLCKDQVGWSLSDQMGKGAVALVFNREAVRLLLGSQHIIDRAQDPNRGWKAIDGGVVTAMKEIGWKEYIHHPSLVQHIGDVSSIGNGRHAKAGNFWGEEFNAEELLECRGA